MHLFFFNYPPTTEIYTLSLYDALPISYSARRRGTTRYTMLPVASSSIERVVSFFSRVDERSRGNSLSTRACLRSEEHTSELQSLRHLVCRLLLEKKKRLQWKTRGTEDS